MSRNLGFGTEMRPKCLDLILGDLRGFNRWVGCWYGLGRHCGSGGAEIRAGVGLVEKKSNRVGYPFINNSIMKHQNSIAKILVWVWYF